MDAGRLFGTDGIRGEAGRYPVDEATAFAVGWALATMVTGVEGREPQVVIGMDTRASGPTLEAALVAGISSAGGRALLVGVLPTPGVALFARAAGADAGVVISASHNPYQDNGIKVFAGSGFKLSDDEESEVEALVGSAPAVESRAAGSLEVLQSEDAITRYAEFLRGTRPAGLSFAGIKVVIDTANGATSLVAPAVFRELGAEVVVMNDQPDGININEGCGSEHTEGLRRLVVETQADLGLAFDGDGDRLMAVDEKGLPLTGDQTLFICAQMLKNEGRLKNDLLVSTVMSNVGLTAACKRLGIENRATDVGDRHVMEEMVRSGAVLGGESSGHVVFLEHHTTGDGILTGIQLITAMLRADSTLSTLSGLMEVFPQTLINVPVKSKPPLDSLPEVMKAIAEVEATLGDEGRVLVRYSGTQDMCRVMVEGPSAEATEAHASGLAAVVASVLG